MNEYFCGTTAFRLFRIPPAIRCMLPCLELPHSPHDGVRLKRALELYGNLGPCLHVLVRKPSERRNRVRVKSHLWTGELPPLSFVDDSFGMTHATPLFALLTMAPCVSWVHLAMAMFELCGDFAVFQPSDEVQRRIDELRYDELGQWRQVADVAGRPTSLWRRPPLIELDELRTYTASISGVRGAKNFVRAAALVSGVASSPFEVQATLRLAISRRLGGEGILGIKNNQRICLTHAARKVLSQHSCYADIFLEGIGDGKDVDIECHGHMVHDGGVQSLLDANRTLALQLMGIEVMLVTHEQLCSRQGFPEIVRHIKAVRGEPYVSKTPQELARERWLMHELFIDWSTLGD